MATHKTSSGTPNFVAAIAAASRTELLPAVALIQRVIVSSMLSLDSYPLVNQIKAYMDERRIHQVFEISILLKEAHAVIECVGGLALALVSTRAIVGLVNLITQDELVEDPHDFVATHPQAFAAGFP